MSTTQMRQQVNAAESLFPGDKITATALPPSGEIASVLAGRPGASALNIPWMLHANREKLHRELASYRQGLFDVNDPEQLADYQALIRASGKDRVAGAELAAYRQFVLTNEIVASKFAFGAFQQVTLGADELPIIIKPKKRQYFNVRYIGNDGQARRDQWQDSRSASLLEMRRLSTDKIEYPLFDIQTGRIEAQNEINAQLKWDMDFKLDILAQDQLDANVTDSGLRALLSLHPKIIQANVPDKNHLDLTGVGTAGVFDITKLKTILAHIASWGVDGITPDGGFTIQTIIISPQNMRDQWDFVNLVSGFSGGDSQPDTVVPTPVREQIFNTGVMNHAWGYTWNTIPNARIDKGRLYVFSNKPVGWFFTKPEFDQVLTWDGPDFQERNEGHVVYNKVVQFVMPDLWLHHYLVVDF